MKLYDKLFEIQSIDLSFKKTANNPFFKSKYLPLEWIMNILSPILIEKKLLVYHTSTWDLCQTFVRCIESDEFVVSEFTITGIDPQKMWSAITYAKRYNLGQIFNIITDEDDDGNKASTKSDSKARPKYTTTQVEKLATWSETVTKWELMQKLAEIKKTYDTTDVDLLLSALTNG